MTWEAPLALAATGGALPKTWVRREGVDYLLKSGTGGENREPYNELLATRLLGRLFEEGEFVPYALVERHGRTYSSCPTMITAETEFISASDVLCAFGVTEGRNVHNGYLNACEKLGVANAEQGVSKMIVADYLMMNFDRHVFNFGLVRNAETLDSYRIATLFDNGCGFCCRATIGELRLGRYLWESHPFNPYPLQQLGLASDYSWYDPHALDGFEDDIADVLGMNPQMTDEFIELVQQQFSMNLKTVNDFAREHGIT